MKLTETVQDTGTLFELADSLSQLSAGKAMHDLVAELYPICRSITGNGVRETLTRLRSYIPLEQHEIPTGTQVFDWTIPREWNIRDGYIKNSDGERIVDFGKHNLSVLNYSAPVSGVMELDELRPHLFSSPEQPDAIPYRTSYYKENWGFCLPHNQLLSLQPGSYEVEIDSTLSEGSLTWGELFLPGKSEEEVLISAHICHPSLANDNLSGIAVATCLAQLLAGVERELSYRFLFIPGTIGAIAWLATNQDRLSRISHGMVLTCVGDEAPLTWKRSRSGVSAVDKAFEHVLRFSSPEGQLRDFSPYGYDERQFCSPGINLSVGCLMRGIHGEFPEYHTSGDNPGFVKPASLTDTAQTILRVFGILESDRRYMNLSPMCEPQLGKRGLYNATGGNGIPLNNLALLWVLNQSDGTNSLLDIAVRASQPFWQIHAAAEALARVGLLAEAD